MKLCINQLTVYKYKIYLFTTTTCNFNWNYLNIVQDQFDK